MISWSQFEARIADHEERIARADRVGWLLSSPSLARQRRGVGATTGVILAWARSRVGVALIVVGHWLTGDKPVAEVG